MLTEHMNILILMVENEKQAKDLPGAEHNTDCSGLCSSEKFSSVIQQNKLLGFVPPTSITGALETNSYNDDKQPLA